jgi:hypothetical protein
MKVIADKDDGRVHRAKTQKIYLVNRDVSDESATFTIMGTTENIYEVELIGSPVCSCPDHQQRKNRCKHILFMLIKIFNVDEPYQEEFTLKEIKKFIKEYKINIAKFNVKYDIKGGCVDVGAKCIEDDCVVCLDSLQNGESYIYCKTSCGRCIHNDCYNMVVKSSKRCPYCNMTDFIASKIIN